MYFTELFLSISLEWFDNDTLFFIKNDSSSNRNTKLFTISSKSWGIKLLYTELDERFVFPFLLLFSINPIVPEGGGLKLPAALRYYF